MYHTEYLAQVHFELAKSGSGPCLLTNSRFQATKEETSVLFVNLKYKGELWRYQSCGNIILSIQLAVTESD